MADPISLGTIAGFSLGTTSVGGIISAVGTGLGALGALQSGSSAAAASRNAAEQQKFSSMVEERQTRKIQAAERAKQAAAYGASGIELTGTPSVFLENQAYEDELDVLTRKYSGAQRARAYKAEAKNEMLAGYSKAGETILTGFK